MKKFSFLPVLLLAFFVFSVASSTFATPQAQVEPTKELDLAKSSTYVSRDVYQALKTGTTANVILVLNTIKSTDLNALSASVATAQTEVLNALSGTNFMVRAQYSHLGIISATIGRDAFNVLAVHPNVTAINLDQTRYLYDDEADVLTNIDAAFGFGFNGAGTRVAVIDSGINTTHANLVDDLFHQACFRTENDCPGGATSAEDQNGHGTHVSGIISGIDGTAPNAEIIALKVFTTGSTSDTNIFNALNAIVANDATWNTNVINMSLGAENHGTQAACDAANPGYVSSFSQLNALGISIFVATGNDGDLVGVGAPGCVTGAIGVGSVSDAVFTAAFGTCTENGQPDKVTCFSNTTSTQGVGELMDILAPGCQITAEWMGSTTAMNTICGTSMATPMMAGIAATILSMNPALTPSEMETLLEDTADPVTDYRNSVVYPRVNAGEALGSQLIDLPTPQNLTAVVVNPNQIDLDWEDIAGETQYNLQRSRDGVNWSILTDTMANDVDYSDMSPECGPNYYRVRGADADSFSAYSNVATATPRPCPLAPTSLVATVQSATSVLLEWQDNATDESGYEIEFSTDSGAFTILTTTLADVESYTHSGFACAIFSYRLRALRAVDDDYSEYSNTVTVSPCAPANDLIANAEVITVAGDTVPDIRYATSSLDDPLLSCSFGGPSAGTNSLWYMYTAPMDQSININTSASDLGPTAADEDTVMGIFTGTPGTLTEQECDDDSGTGFLSQISGFNVTSGTTYYIEIVRWDTSPMANNGTLQVAFSTGATVPRPANDKFANAEVITGTTFTDTEPNAVNATRSGNDPVFDAMATAPSDCSASFFPTNGSQTIWYQFTPSANGTVDIDTLSTTGTTDTVIGVYTGTLGSLTQVACGDESSVPNSLTELSGVPVTGGTTYFFHVARWSATPTGTAFTYVVNFSSTVTSGGTSTFTPVPPTSTNTPVPPTSTNTPVPGTATNTPDPGTATNTPDPATATATTEAPTATATTEPVSGTEMLLNGGFEIDAVAPLKQPDNWNVVNKTQDKIKCNTVANPTVAFAGTCAYFFKGSALEATKLSQKPNLALHTLGAGDTLTFSVQYKTNAAAPKLKYKVIIRYTDTTLALGKVKGTINTASSAGYTERLAADYVLLNGSVSMVKVQFMNRALSGKIFIDAASLIHMDNSAR